MKSVSQGEKYKAQKYKADSWPSKGQGEKSIQWWIMGRSTRSLDQFIPTIHMKWNLFPKSTQNATKFLNQIYS